MKEVTAIIDFFMNEDNMQYLLKGNEINNLNEVHHNIFTNIENQKGSIFVYEPRHNDPNHPDNKFDNNDKKRHNTEFPDESDKIVAKVLRYVKRPNGKDALEIEITDALFFSKLNEPVIKLNGYYSTSEDGTIHIDKIVRLTLADRNS